MKRHLPRDIFGALKIIINLNLCSVDTIGLHISPTVLEYCNIYIVELKGYINHPM